MLIKEIFVEIHVLHRQGHGIKAIARQLSISKNTVRKYLKQPIELPAYTSRTARPTKLEPFKPYILERIEAAKPKWIPAVVLLREIREQGYQGYQGEITILRNFVFPYKQVMVEPVVRFETEPGEQMQVDFTVTYKEDDSRIRRGDGPENMATFRWFAMNLARLSPVKDSMRGKLKQVAWSDDFREKLLFG